MTSSRDRGSSTTGLALASASRRASAPAILNDISDESTGWNLPSKQVTRMSTTGQPKMPPSDMASSAPFCTAGMYWRGITPPTMLSTNSKPAPLFHGLDAQRRHSELAVAAGLLLVLALGLGVGRDGLPVGDHELLALDADTELAGQALHGDGDVASRPSP